MNFFFTQNKRLKVLKRGNYLSIDALNNISGFNSLLFGFRVRSNKGDSCSCINLSRNVFRKLKIHTKRIFIFPLCKEVSTLMVICILIIDHNWS